MKTKLLLLAISPLFLNGCLSTSRIVEQLKNDPATVDFSVQTIYGSVTLHRAFPTNWTQPITVVMPSTITTNRP